MKPKDVIKYYGTQQKAAEALGCKQPSISEWVRNGCVPLLRQFQIEALTGGKLKADRKSGFK